MTNATINRDLAALRRAFRLAVEARQIPSAPKFPRLKEAAPRSGFVEQTEYNKLSAQATELWLRAMLAAAYTFGSRKSELLGTRVNQVDLIHRTIRLNPGETKNDEGRMAVMTDEVHTLIAACVAGKRGEDHVFMRNSNRQVKDFRERWDKLVADAGCGSLLFHDLRRSAVRNMVRSGIPEVVAMRISGHKTRSIFDRYNIVSERDLIEAARKLEMVQNWPKNAELHQSRAVEIVMENQVNYVN